MGRRLSWTASAVVNMGEEFIPPYRSPSFILGGQHLPKSSHIVEQMTGQSLISWRASKGAPETEGQLRFSLTGKVKAAKAGSSSSSTDCSRHKKKVITGILWHLPKLVYQGGHDSTTSVDDERQKEM